MSIGSYLDRVNIMSNDNKHSLLVLNELGDMVDTVLQDDWLGFVGLGRSLSNLQQSCLLGSLILRTVLLEKLEHVGSCCDQVSGFLGVECKN